MLMWLKIIQSRIWLYGFAAMVFALLQILSLQNLTMIPGLILLSDSLLFSLWLILLSVPLFSLVRYGNLQSVQLPVRIFIYTVLGVFVLTVILGGISAIEWYLFKNLWTEFFKILPLKGVLAFVSFLLLIQYSIYQRRSEEEYRVDNTENEPDPGKSSEKEIVNSSDAGIQERIAVKSGARIHVVPLQEIICLMADGDYVLVVTEKGRYLKEQTMKYFESHLPPNQFIRIHRSCIVNVSFISRIELYEKQNQQLLLKNGDKVKISQAGYRLLRERLGM